MLSDQDLIKLVKEHQLVKPFVESRCEGATINLTLGPEIKRYSSNQPITLFQKIDDASYEIINLEEQDFNLEPGQSVLGHTYEKVSIPNNFAALILERYSIKSLGIMISPAGYMNPGYSGNVGFLIVNHSPVPVRLVPGVQICQLAVNLLSSTPTIPYGSQEAKYMDAKGATLSRLHLESEVQEFIRERGIRNISDRTVRSLGKHLMSQVRSSAKKLADVLKDEMGDSEREPTP